MMRLLPYLFSLTLFSSAFLSFSVQPILGKMLLPMVGGAPAGWIVAMAFFQLALLAGYGISWLLERFSAWVHLGFLLALYGLGALFLPPALPEISGAFHGPALSLAVVAALFKAIFVPFLALTATTSALQRVFAATRHKTAGDPYYLFVASNIGSFGGLLCYPFLLELLYGLSQQALYWQALYGCVVLLIALSGLSAWRFREPVSTAPAPVKTPVSRHDLLLWLALSFIPCSLSMGVTTLITTDVAGVPLFWVVPLGLYLLTFILAFSRREFASASKLNYSHVNAVGFMVCILALGLGLKPTGDVLTFAVITILLLEVFFVIAWACHRRLALMRPATDRLALFYFVVALGGGLAGILHAFVLPFLLNDVIEFPVIVLVSLLLHPDFRQKPAAAAGKLKKLFPVFTAVSIALALVLLLLQNRQVENIVYIPFAAVFVLSFLFISGQPRLLLLVGTAVFAFSQFSADAGDLIAKGRNFFGSYKVYEQKNGTITLRYFTHGNTQHGMAIYGGTDEQKYNSTYYARKGPIGDILKLANAQSLGVVGLGVGQLACIDPALTVDFYEIDGEVLDIAKTYFPYLEECPVRDVHIGDGRLEIAKTDAVYDVLLLDAFTSDGVPAHLLTQEAVREYRKHVGDNGIMLFHVSNRYFDLGPNLAKIARAMGLEAYSLLHKPDTKANPFMLMSKWIAIPMRESTGGQLAAAGWKKPAPSPILWTDERSSLLTAINLKDPTQD